MVNVAKDGGLVDADLPSAGAPAPSRDLVGGVSLEGLLTLPSLAGTELVHEPDQLLRGVLRASLLGASPAPWHHLVCTDAETVEAWEAAGQDALEQSALDGAAALAIAGGSSEQVRRWRE